MIERFVRPSFDPDWFIGAKVRCFNPGRKEMLKENDIYTVSWLDWPFCFEVEELPGVTLTLDRFKPYKGEIMR